MTDEANVTKEEFAASVPPPPPEAGEQKLPEGAEDPQASDDSNPDADFWAELSNDKDEEDAPEEQPASQPTVDEPSPAVPAEPPPAEPPVVETPAPELDAPAPVEDLAPQEPSAPQTSELSPEEVQAFGEKWKGELASHYSSLVEDEEFANRLITEPQKVLPQLLAETTATTMKNAYQLVQEVVPQMAQQMAQQVIQSELGKRAFFRKHPALREHEAKFEPFLAAYRMLPQNAGRGFEDVSSEAAVAYSVRNRIPINGMPIPGAQSAVQIQPSAPPPPPPAATAPTAPQGQGNFWSEFADQIVEDDF